MSLDTTKTPRRRPPAAKTSTTTKKTSPAKKAVPAKKVAPARKGAAATPPVAQKRPVAAREKVLPVENSEAVVAGSSGRLRRNGPRMRSSGPEQSVERILAATFDAISRHGLLRLSLSDVCRAAGVARGTLYRYFPTKEDLLDGLGARTRERFESALRDLRASTDTPDERLEGVLRILIEQEEEAAGDRMLQIEPLFVLDFFGRLLPYYSELVAATLEPFFDQVERQFDMKIDRLLMSEVLLRVRLSLILMPPQDNLFGTRLRAAWNATVERQIKRSSGR